MLGCELRNGLGLIMIELLCFQDIYIVVEMRCYILIALCSNLLVRLYKQVRTARAFSMYGGANKVVRVSTRLPSRHYPVYSAIS